MEEDTHTIIFSKRSQRLRSGNKNNCKTSSIFIRPSSIFKNNRHLYVDIYVYIVVLDNLDVYVSIDGGSMYSNDLYNATRAPTTCYGWPKSFLAASFTKFYVGTEEGSNSEFSLKIKGTKYTVPFDSPESITQNNDALKKYAINVFFSNFGIYCKPQGGKATGYSVARTDPNKPLGWSNGYTRPPSGLQSSFPQANKRGIDVGDEISPKDLRDKGFRRLGTMSQTFHDYIYISGLCLFNGSGSSETPKATSYADVATVEIKNLKREVLEYYPASILTDGVWKSCNRPKGYVKIKQSSGWIDRKNNNFSDKSKPSTVFLRTNNSWTKAPLQ